MIDAPDSTKRYKRRYPPVTWRLSTCYIWLRPSLTGLETKIYLFMHTCFIENLCRYSFTLSCTLVHARSRIPERVKSTEYYSNGYYTNPSPTLGWIKPMATSCLLSNSENWIKRLHVKTDSLTKPTKKRNSSVRGRLDVGSIKKSRRPDKAWPCAKKG